MCILQKYIIFLESLHYLNTPPPTSSPLCERLYASLVKLFAETLELVLHAMFQLDIHKIASLEHILQGAKKLEVVVC